jgi:hypothetical protein
MSSSQQIHLHSPGRELRQVPNANRRLDDHLLRALNRIRKPSTAEEITELLNRLPLLLAGYIAIGDKITFPIPVGNALGAEIYIAHDCFVTRKTSAKGWQVFSPILQYDCDVFGM